MNERKLTANALNKLKSNTGLECSVTESIPVFGDQQSVNTLIQFENYPAQLVAELRKWAADSDSRTIIRQLSNEKSTVDRILICEYINEDLGRRLRKEKINYLDKVGNAFIVAESLYVSIQGKQPVDKVEDDKANPLFTETGLKVIFALLTNHGLLNTNYRRVADCANVSMGTIGWVLRALKDQGFTVESRHKRGWNDRPRLLRKWVDEFSTLRVKTHIGRYYTQDEQWWKTVELKKYDAVLGGEIAASMQAGNFTPELGCIYVGRNQQGNLIRDLQLVPAGGLISAGVSTSIEILSKFWGHVDDNTAHTDITHPLLTYADLFDSWDPKSQKTAEQIFELYLRD